MRLHLHLILRQLKFDSFMTEESTFFERKIFKMLTLVVEVIYGLVRAVVYAVVIFIKNRFPGKFSKSIEGETILLTGGGSGIGRIMGRKLAALGATVVTLDVNEKGNDETVR